MCVERSLPALVTEPGRTACHSRGAWNTLTCSRSGERTSPGYACSAQPRGQSPTGWGDPSVHRQCGPGRRDRQAELELGFAHDQNVTRVPSSDRTSGRAFEKQTCSQRLVEQEGHPLNLGRPSRQLISLRRTTQIRLFRDCCLLSRTEGSWDCLGRRDRLRAGGRGRVLSRVMAQASL